MTEINLAQEKREIDGQVVEFFKLSQRSYSKVKRKMVAAMTRLPDLKSEDLVTVALMDTDFFDLVQEIVYPIIRVNGKDISEDINYETVMSQAPETFETKLYHEILGVYLGKFIAALTKEDGSETQEEKKDVPIKKIGRIGSSGNQS